MNDLITLCGDNCTYCPRMKAQTSEELEQVAKLWMKAGFRDHIVSNEEIACQGCSSHKNCTYQLVECIKEHGVEKCNLCIEFPCSKITTMLEKTMEHKKRCQEVCTDEEYRALEKAFFEKKINLKK